MGRPADWIPLNQRDHLSFAHIMGIAAGTLCPMLLWAVLQTLMSPLCEKLKLSNIVKTLLLLWGSLTGFVVNPLFGAWSDASMCRWGRRRPYIVGGSILLFISILAMVFCEPIGAFFSKNNPLRAQQAIFISAVLIVFIFGNVVQIPVRALCSDVVPQHQQVLMSNICVVYTGIGGILMNLCGGLELYKYTPLEQEPFMLMVWSVLSAVAIIVTVIVTPEEPLSEKPPATNVLKQLWVALKRLPKSVKIALFCYFWGQTAAFQFLFQFTHFMGKEIFGGDNASPDPAVRDKYQKGLSWAMMCNVVYFASQFVYGFLNTKMFEVFTIRWVFVFTMFLMTGVLVSFFFVRNKYVLMAAVIPLGICAIVYFAGPYAIITLAIPTEELGGNLGLVICAGVIGEIVANFGIGNALGMIWDYQPSILIGLGAIPALFGAISGFWLTTPGPNAYAEYRAKIYTELHETASMEDSLM